MNSFYKVFFSKLNFYFKKFFFSASVLFFLNAFFAGSLYSKPDKNSAIRQLNWIKWKLTEPVNGLFISYFKTVNFIIERKSFSFPETLNFEKFYEIIDTSFIEKAMDSVSKGFKPDLEKLNETKRNLINLKESFFGDFEMIISDENRLFNEILDLLNRSIGIINSVNFNKKESKTWILKLEKIKKEIENTHNDILSYLEIMEDNLLSQKKSELSKFRIIVNSLLEKISLIESHYGLSYDFFSPVEDIDADFY